MISENQEGKHKNSYLKKSKDQPVNDEEIEKCEELYSFYNAQDYGISQSPVLSLVCFKTMDKLVNFN